MLNIEMLTVTCSESWNIRCLVIHHIAQLVVLFRDISDNTELESLDDNAFTGITFLRKL